MASWGGEGPAGKSCRECQYWLHAGYLESGMIKKAVCNKFQSLMSPMRRGIPIPHYAPACKYFTQVDNSPSAFREKK